MGRGLGVHDKLTADDLSTLGAGRDKFINKIEARYGYDKDQAPCRFEDWAGRVGQRVRVWRLAWVRFAPWRSILVQRPR